MKINMKNLNVFRRLDELESANLHLNVMLQEARRGIERLQKMTAPKPKAKPGPKPGPKAVRTKAALNAMAEKKREYARRYYAKKKAERAA